MNDGKYELRDLCKTCHKICSVRNYNRCMSIIKYDKYIPPNLIFFEDYRQKKLEV